MSHLNEKNHTIQCVQCAASLTYDPGSTSLACQYCGAENEIIVESTGDHLIEQSFHDFEKEIIDNTIESQMIQCNHCAAQFEIKETEGSGECAFCCTPYVVNQVKSSKVHKPTSVLPFLIDQHAARGYFKEWIHSLWWAPSAIKELGKHLRRLQGIYYPYWTYDCETGTHYNGERGDYYYVTRTRQVRGEDGNYKSEQYQERRTRWTPAIGHVFNSFDDILVPAHNSLDRKTLNELEPWAMDQLQPYSSQFIQGFTLLNYEVSMRDGFHQFAKPQIETAVDSTIRQDIGGDEQRIYSMDLDFSHQTFKHILLPVWVSSYRFKGKVYHITINASTGEVQGERPYSWIKISLAVICAIIVIVGVILLVKFYA